MNRIFLFFMIFILSVSLSAAEIDIPAGEVMQVPFSNESGGAEFKIAKLNDSDPKYAPTTGFIFYGVDDKLELSVGIRKLEGKQGLVSYYHFEGSGSSVKPRLIKPNLKFNTDYEISYYLPRQGRIVLKVTDEFIGLNVDFEILRVEHVTSGMKLIDLVGF